VYLHEQFFVVDLSVTQHTRHAEDLIRVARNSLPHAAVAGDVDASGDRASTHTHTYTNNELAAIASAHDNVTVNQASASSRTAEQVSKSVD
jgi:hypothetical protein